MVNLKKVKSALEAKRDELQARVDSVDRHLREPGETDWEENAIASEDHEVLNEIGAVTAAELKDVQLALSRIESGDYGKCASCGGPIGNERLEALPYATTCIHCA